LKTFLDGLNDDERFQLLALMWPTTWKRASPSTTIAARTSRPAACKSGRESLHLRDKALRQQDC
jgi:hypothetical protein